MVPSNTSRGCFFRILSLLGDYVAAKCVRRGYYRHWAASAAAGGTTSVGSYHPQEQTRSGSATEIPPSTPSASATWWSSRSRTRMPVVAASHAAARSLQHARTTRTTTRSISWAAYAAQRAGKRLYTGNKSAPIQLAECRFPGLAIFSAKILIYYFK